ncbi:MAG: tetratricopeptide repeat protein [Chitinophagales bacterium]
MKFIIQKLFLQAVIFFSAIHAFAQVNWPAPEVGQMYRNAQEYVAAGNFKDAVITYKQAIILAPGIMILYRDLGDALYRSGNYNEAEQVLTPLLTKPEADAQCYQLLAVSQAAQQHTKHAMATLKKGLARFPESGLLYHETGKVYDLEKKQEAALNVWLDGISKEPGFAENYYDAASIYLSSDKSILPAGRQVWGLLYGEMFLAMEHDTTGDDAMKSKLFKAWKTMFDNIVQDEVPQYGKPVKHAPVTTFEAAVQQVYSSLTPVVSDGITTENLTMVRARFLMEWFSVYGKKYPFSYFTYLDNVIRSGHFDMYNEWLFGKAESAIQYEAWNTFHEGDMQRFLQWKSANRFTPAGNDSYNDRNIRPLFSKKKK